MNVQDKRRYPIGQFEYGKKYSLEDTRKNIKALERFPKDLKKILKKLRSADLDTPYRRGGWTVRQVVHHLADSHMNAYIRMKMAVSEIIPVIKPYEEDKWAEMEDGKESAIKVSVKLLTALHRRWITFLSSLSTEDLECSYHHPAMQRTIALPEAIALYVWHSKHHFAHIELVLKSKHDEEEDEKESRSKTDNKKKSAETAVENKKKDAKKEKKAAEKPKKPSRPGASPELLAKARAVRKANAEAKKLAETGGNATINELLPESTVVAPEPKKRGPKSKVTAVEAPAATETAVAAPEPKKRGPKPKAAAVEAPAATETAVATPEPKKRGPKPKAVVAEAPAAPESAVAAPEPKKRGPKPKAAAAEAPAATETAVAAPEPKKRSPKSQTAAASKTAATTGKSKGGAKAKAAAKPSTRSRKPPETT